MLRLVCMLLIALGLLFAAESKVDTDALAEQSINEANSFADALEAGKSLSEIETISVRLSEINATINSLPERQIKSMLIKHGDKYAEAMRRICKFVAENRKVMAEQRKALPDSPVRI
jgi:hypothetical protein